MANGAGTIGTNIDNHTLAASLIVHLKQHTAQHATAQQQRSIAYRSTAYRSTVGQQQDHIGCLFSSASLEV